MRCPKCSGQIFKDYDSNFNPEPFCLQCGYREPPKVILKGLVMGAIGFHLTESKKAKIEKELVATRKIYTRRSEL